jgi:hypothetical protein
MVARRKWMLRATAHCSQGCQRRPHPVTHRMIYGEGWGHFLFETTKRCYSIFPLWAAKR